MRARPIQALVVPPGGAAPNAGAERACNAANPRPKASAASTLGDPAGM